MSDKDKRKVPVLRFKGFTNDWELHKLDEIVKFYGGLTYHPENIQEDGTLVLRSSNIHNNQIVLKDTVHVSPEIVNTSNVNVNDIIVVVRNGSRKLIGKHARVLKAMPNTVIGAFMTGIRSQNGKFVNALFDGDIFQREIYKNLGATINQITIKSFKEMEFYIPQNHEKQIIGNLISQIDNLLALQQRKLDELIQIKEGIGQGLLNRHYRNLSIRFNQENSPWKQTKLGKIASFVNGRAFKQKELMNRGLYPVLRVGNFYTNNKWYYSNLNLSPDKYANKGDLLYTWSASFGPHVWKGPKVIYHYHIWKINFDPAVISKAYLYEFLKLDKKEILANSNGSTMIHITKKDMENKMITVPDMNEQIKIGKILEKLDLKIELNKNKLNNLKSVKQFLLQKMFM
ncbi:restriction endonuclease subunit S [Lactobacillus amylovorus]|uniref:restriction endonuclease subunit S n=1 Tax=Lactobacillus amylovorus TaxID=1604 RepID=UPI00232C1FB4|nr:restriction endonuclease subunit S [Lactobacillus amylovorus]MDB6264099.1 restriction endonuclease subunit S [Lactobacillus amylovorus]